MLCYLVTQSFLEFQIHHTALSIRIKNYRLINIDVMNISAKTQGKAISLAVL